MKRGRETGRDSQNYSRRKKAEEERKQSTEATACGKMLRKTTRSGPNCSMRKAKTKGE